MKTKINNNKYSGLVASHFCLWYTQSLLVALVLTENKSVYCCFKSNTEFQWFLSRFLLVPMAFILREYLEKGSAYLYQKVHAFSVH